MKGFSGRNFPSPSAGFKRLPGIFGARTYAIASSVLDTSRRLSAPGDGGKSRRRLHHSGEAQTLCVTPHAVPALCGLGGVAPPARPSDSGAACEGPLPALGVLSQAQDRDGPVCRDLRQSVPRRVVRVPDRTGHTRWHPLTCLHPLLVPDTVVELFTSRHNLENTRLSHACPANWTG